MSKLRVVFVLVGLVVLVGLGYLVFHNSNKNTPSNTSTTSNSTSQSSSNEPASGTINIRNMMFTPSQIAIKKGGTVTWTNNDTTTHTVIDDLQNVGGPHSGNIEPGATYSFKFESTGSFQYHCSIHPSMRGTIVVK